MKQQSEWPAEWTAQIGRSIRHARTQAGLSAEGLSRRCSDLGVSIPRNTISNLENGRKASIPLHEVVVLATALGHAPVELMAPFATAEKITFLPGEEVEAYTLADLIAGNAIYLGPGAFSWDDPSNGSIKHWRAFWGLVDTWDDLGRSIADGRNYVAEMDAAIDGGLRPMEGVTPRLSREEVIAELRERRQWHLGRLDSLTESRRGVARDALRVLDLISDLGELTPQLPEGVLEEIRKEASDGEHQEAP